MVEDGWIEEYGMEGREGNELHLLHRCVYQLYSWKS